jgi:hypothetical protein
MLRGEASDDESSGVSRPLNARREIRRRQRRRRRFVASGVIVVVGVGCAVAVPQVIKSFAGGPDGASGAPLNGSTASSATRARIVSLVQGQMGYTTSPSNTYCNKFSAYWYSGASDCGNTNRDEQWCADFAAWAWRSAGVPVVFQFVNGDLNSSSASFYEWGVRHHTWHPVGSGYVPQPGDVAVYGLDATSLVAQHVAVVVSYTPGDRGPNAVNGDGDRTGFSRVEYLADEFDADTTSGGDLLAGYVAPSA